MLAIGAVVGVELIIAPQSREDHLGRLEVCTEMGIVRSPKTAAPARAILDVDNIDVIADRSYFKIEDIKVYEKSVTASG